MSARRGCNVSTRRERLFDEAKQQRKHLLKEAGQERRHLFEEAGQMSVEAALVLPVVIVLAFVMANALLYVEACITFDRIAYDAVLSQGVAPSGEQSTEQASSAIQSTIEEALNRSSTCEVTVVAYDVDRFSSSGDAVFSIVPTLTRYECTLYFTPWGSTIQIAGVSFTPAALTHTRSYVVDRYRSGVVV